jgi:hypothetical protein
MSLFLAVKFAADAGCAVNAKANNENTTMYIFILDSFSCCPELKLPCGVASRTVGLDAG